MDFIKSNVFELYYEYNIGFYLKYIIYLRLCASMLLLMLIILDLCKKYSHDQLLKEIKKNTISEEKHEYYYTYWIWQRKKRKYITKVLSTLSHYKDHPKIKWEKRGIIKCPFQRKCWIEISHTTQEFLK